MRNRVTAWKALALFSTAFVLAALCGAQRADPNEIRRLISEGQQHELAGNLDAAYETYEQLVDLAPREPSAWLLRGSVLFKRGQILAAIEDFDRVATLAPKTEPQLWQRGIAYYYLGRNKDCVGQFDRHREVNPNDTENAVWHLLCRAKLDGIKTAQAEILPVGPDSRVPMTAIYELFAGHGKPGEVLAAAEASGETQPLFYAHLYLGLYADMLGQKDKALIHLEKATAIDFPHYMGDVARIHLDRLAP